MSMREKGQNMKTLWESLGPEKFHQKIVEVMDGDKPLMAPEDFSVQEIYEAVDPTAFPTITGLLISKKVMDAYTKAPVVGRSLVTVFTSSLQVDRVTGFTETGDMRKLIPGEPYPHIADIGEKWVQIEGDKYGKILDVLEETVKFDQTGKLLMRAAAIGEGAAMFQEKHIMNTIQDVTGYEAYYPSNAQATLYSGGHSNQITDVLQDWTDLDAARLILSAQTDEKGDPILLLAGTILTPDALNTTAVRLYRNTAMPGAANAEENPFKNRFNPVSSPYLDLQSTTAWYLGDFKKQYAWKEVFPLTVQTRKSNDNEAAWERDVLASFKVRYFGDCGALDYRFVAKSTGAGS